MPPEMAVLALLPSSLDSTALLASMGFQLRGPLSFSLIIGRLSGNPARAYALYRRPTVPSGPCPFQVARTWNARERREAMGGSSQAK